MRFDTFKNTDLYKYDCAYVVAQSQNSVKDDGFGIVYPECNNDTFPTAHENLGDKRVNYDVKLYNRTNKSQIYVNIADTRFTCYNLSESTVVRSIFFNIEYNMIMSDAGNKAQYTIDSSDFIVNFAEIDGDYINHNV
jgi:hypothetical protein